MLKSDSESRRVKITKRLMKDALMELMEKKPLASISVTDLCAVADVNRSTFYSYYSDLLELLREIEDDILAQLPQGSEKNERLDLNQRFIDDFTVFFGYVRKHARDFNVLLRSGDLQFSQRMMEAIMQHFRRPETETASPILTQWGYIYSMNGVIGLIREWIASGFPMEDREFAELALQMSFRANDFPQGKS